VAKRPRAAQAETTATKPQSQFNATLVQLFGTPARIKVTVKNSGKSSATCRVRPLFDEVDPIKFEPVTNAAGSVQIKSEETGFAVFDIPKEWGKNPGARFVSVEITLTDAPTGVRVDETFIEEPKDSTTETLFLRQEGGA
jgi:hypothetical protein